MAKTKTPATRQRSGTPVILFPLHGSEDVQEMTQAEYEAALRKHRLMLRKHWNHDGVKSIVALLELTTARLLHEAIAPDSTMDDVRRAGGASEQLAMLRTILVGQEQD